MIVHAAPAVVLAPRDLTKPLLSSASDALPAVAARLIKLGSAIETTPALLTPEDEAILIAGGDALKSAGGNDAPGYDFTPACDVVKRVLETWTPQALAQAYFPSLCILRVLVLQEPAAVYWTTTGALPFVCFYDIEREDHSRDRGCCDCICRGDGV